MRRGGMFGTIAAVSAALGCGGNPPTLSGSDTVSATSTPAPVGAAPGFVITIQNMGFSPLHLAVPPGATVTVVNDDGIQHSVTSEASTGSYTPGAPDGLTPFDTGVFSSGRRTFTLPANATAGTVIPYYCTVHRQTMNTPNGTITIDPNARPVTSTSSTATPTGSSTTPTTPTSMPSIAPTTTMPTMPTMPIAPSMPANGRGY